MPSRKQPLIALCLCAGVGVLMATMPSALLAQEVFSDDFETGDLTAWSTFQPPLATSIVSTSPMSAETAVALTRETIFTFEAPIDASSLDAAAVHAETEAGMAVPANLHLSADARRVTLFYDPPLPLGTLIKAIVDGERLQNANGQNVDANGDDHPGGTRTLTFTTLGLASEPGTRVCGRVLASETDMVGGDVPLEGVTVSVDGVEATYSAVTDALGNYCLDPAPSDRFFVHIDGSTASNPVPKGAYYPTVGKAFEPKPGLTYYVGESYLPLIAAGTLQPVSTTADTTINLPASVLAERPELAGSELMVPAGSLFSNDGLPGTSAGLAPVPSDRLPGNLPSDLDFPVVFTVQTDGATNFDTPAPVCFPNLVQPSTGQVLPAGAIQSLVSFDHDAGRWRPVGGMTVTPDETLICSNAGTGIVAPGWHMPSPPPIFPPPPVFPPPPPGPHPPHDEPPMTPDEPSDPPEESGDPPCTGGSAAACSAGCDKAETTCDYTMIGISLVCGGAIALTSPSVGLALVLGAYCTGGPGAASIHGCGGAAASCQSACNDACGGSRTGHPADTLASPTGGTDPVLLELMDISSQILALVEPYRFSGDPVPSETIDQVAALVDDAETAAGGDPVAYAEAAAAAAWAEVEPSVPAGNAPHYPILYMAEYLRNGDIVVERGETDPYGQFTLFPGLRADLQRVRFYDPYTHSTGIVAPADLGSGVYGVSRFYLLPVDDALVSDLDGDTLADDIEVIYGSNPMLVDTDGDGASDRDEIIAGTDLLGRDIEVGEVVSDVLAVAGELDRYTLAALAGQSLFFDIQSGAGGDKDWSFVDPDGTVIFDRTFSNDPGTVELSRGGNYTLLLGDDSGAATGGYQFQVWDVPAPDTFAYSIGDVVSDGVPGAGAGHIESPGALDVYTFTATAGQDVFFDLQAGATGGIDWHLTDAVGATVFFTFLGGDRGVVTLEDGGTYTLTIGDPTNDHTGTYQFQLWDVPAPDTFPISIGDIVSDGVPAAGAGHIETPGVHDVYTFTATAGQDVFFDLQAGATSGVDWHLTDAVGATVFFTFLGGDRGVVTLEDGGTYTLTIGDPTNDHTGTYQFQLWDVPAPDTFPISIGDIVSDGVPAAGAGHIETPGVRDVYTFSASAGQTVLFDIQAGATSDIDWTLVDGGGSTVFDTFFGNDETHTLAGGSYTLTVGADDNDFTGTYQVELTPQ